MDENQVLIIINIA